MPISFALNHNFLRWSLSALAPCAATMPRKFTAFRPYAPARNILLQTNFFFFKKFLFWIKYFFTNFLLKYAYFESCFYVHYAVGNCRVAVHRQRRMVVTNLQRGFCHYSSRIRTYLFAGMPHSILVMSMTKNSSLTINAIFIFNRLNT
jgi:hypothetical protein